MVEHAVLTQASDQTDGYTEDELNCDGEQREPQRYRERAHQNVVHALPAERRSQVSLEEITQIQQVAREERFVQVELRFQRRVLCRGRRLIAKEGEDRIAREQE